MAARKPKLLTVNEAQSFDFDAFVLGFKRPEFTRNLYQRADLLPKLAELDALTTELQTQLDKAEAAEGDKPERSIDDVDVVTTLRTRLNRLIVEFNELYEQYEASAVAFTFRVPDQSGDWAEIKTRMLALGADSKVPPKDDDEEAQVHWLTAQAIAGMSVTCTSHPMDVEQWSQFRAAVGDAALATLVQAWNEAVKAVVPAAPFSPKVSPGQDSSL
jgi:hypothetical protein